MHSIQTMECIASFAFDFCTCLMLISSHSSKNLGLIPPLPPTLCPVFKVRRGFCAPEPRQSDIWCSNSKGLDTAMLSPRMISLSLDPFVPLVRLELIECIVHIMDGCSLHSRCSRPLTVSSPHKSADGVRNDLSTPNRLPRAGTMSQHTQQVAQAKRTRDGDMGLLVSHCARSQGCSTKYVYAL